MESSNEVGGPAQALAHPTKAVLRWNALLSVALLLVIGVLANLLADRYLRVRADLSADGLNQISPATQRIVGGLEDLVTVRLFVTEDVKDGQFALRTARVRGQLDEILQLRPDSFELQVLDPSRSSEAQRRADEVGFRPFLARGSRLGGRAAGEPVWLSLELSYRGRTERISTPQPFEFETQFASALHGAMADRKPGIGWIGAPILPPAVEGTRAAQEIAGANPSYKALRLALERRARFVMIEGLETGRSIPDDIDVVFIVTPDQLDDRVAFEVDRFVQRGGKLIVCIDDPAYNPWLGSGMASATEFRSTTLGQMLKGWGIEVLTAKHIWDAEWKSRRVAVVSGQDGRPTPRQLISPMVIQVPDAGLNESLAPTRGVEEVQFTWAHALMPEALVKTPPGVTREDLVWSSDTAWLDDVMGQLPREPAAFTQTLSYLRQRSAPARHVLAAVFSGSFPSHWKGRPAPPIGDRTPEESAAPPVEPRAGARIVVFGDADWLRDPWSSGRSLLMPFSRGGGLVLAENLIDWLTLDEELIGLRSRVPVPRPLRDFAEEEMKASGVFDRDPFETDAEAKERDKKADSARGRARRKQWLTMLLPAGGALLCVALFGLAWNLSQRQRRGEVPQ